MNKNLTIGLVVALLIILLGWAVYSSPKATETSNTNTENTQTNTQTQTTKQPVTSSPKLVPQNDNTFPAIFTQAGSHECDYESVSGNSRSSNTIYIADGKMRGEFRTISSGQSTGSMMVYNSGVLYIWTEGMGVGTKTQLKSVSDLPTIIPKDLTSGTVLGSGLNSIGWNCHDWAKNSSLLSPPSYVHFQ